MSCKARFSHFSISLTTYVLESLLWLYVSNRVRYWNKVKNINYVGSKLQLCQLELPIFIYKLYYLCVWQVIWTLSRSDNWKLGIATPIMRKNIKLFLKCGGYNSCRKVKYIWSSHFPYAITTHMQIKNDFFVFNYPVTCKQKFSTFSLFLLKLM
jgi:hypothetical protein